jgi:hypothetical protein
VVVVVVPVAIMIVIVAAHEVLHGGVITAAEAFTIGFTLLVGQVGTAILFAILHVGAAMIVEVLAGTLDSILEALAAKLVKFVWSSIPWPLGEPRAPIRSTDQMRHTNVVSSTEAFAVGAPHPRWNAWTAIFFAIIDIWPAVVADVFAGAFNAVVESTALHVIPGVGWTTPVVTILCES